MLAAATIVPVSSVSLLYCVILSILVVVFRSYGGIRNQSRRFVWQNARPK